MTDLRVVPFNGGNPHDIPACLRNLADLIESGAQGVEVPGITDATHLVWITVAGASVPEVGAIGPGMDKYKAAGIALGAAGKLTRE